MTQSGKRNNRGHGGKKRYHGHRYARKSSGANMSVRTDDGMTMEYTDIRDIIVHDCSVILPLCTCYVEEYVEQFDFGRFDYEEVSVAALGGGLKDVLFDRLLYMNRGVRMGLRIPQRALMWKRNVSLVIVLEEYLQEHYHIASGAKSRDYHDALRSCLNEFDEQFLEYSRELFEHAINRNASYKELDRKIYEAERRLKSMISDSIPEHMPDLYPLARNMKRRFVLHVGPTNSGKTYNALECLKRAGKGVYLAPLRLLAYEIFDRLNQAGVICDMVTGEEEMLLPMATHISCTIETLDVLEEYDVAVIDECQMIGDRQRGGAWTRALLGVCAKEVHVCSDISCLNLVIRIIEECNDTYTIEYHDRAVPLVADTSEKFKFPESVRENDALIVFSKKACVAVAAKLQSYGIKASMIYGNLPYDVRMSEVKRFATGETKVVVATDAIGMGLNLPIERIVFLETRKYDGEDVRTLTVSEVKQITGRAGRRGIFEKGYYASEYFMEDIIDAVNAPLPSVDRARISIPESIISLDYPLSEIIEKWTQTANEEIYEKADLTEDLMLLKKLETVASDKKILFDFLNIGFKSNKYFLYEIIMECARMEEESGNDIESDIEDLIDYTAVYFEHELEEMNLERLEDLYLKYDLLYAYLKKFNHREQLAGLTELKKQCSAMIIEKLKTEELELRRCCSCKRELPWNYPYKLCNNCFDKGVRVRRHR